MPAKLITSPDLHQQNDSFLIGSPFNILSLDLLVMLSGHLVADNLQCLSFTCHQFYSISINILANRLQRLMESNLQYQMSINKNYNLFSPSGSNRELGLQRQVGVPTNFIWQIIAKLVTEDDKNKKLTALSLRFNSLTDISRNWLQDGIRRLIVIIDISIYLNPDQYIKHINSLIYYLHGFFKEQIDLTDKDMRRIITNGESILMGL